MTHRLTLLTGLLVAFGGGCDGDTAGEDAGADADVGADAALPAPTAPTPAASPVLTPCPDGWQEVGDAEPFGCAPWPFDAPPTCSGASARFVGASACATLGSSCPTDGFPEGVPTDALFVSAAAPAGGDGSRAAPFASIGDALAVATSGQTVAIGVGEYVEAVDVPAGVTLWGACAESTVIRSDAERYDRGVLTIEGADVFVKNLRIAESEQSGIWVSGEGRSVEVEDVLVEDVLVAGINVEQGSGLTARRLVVRRPRATVLGTFGRGLTIETGSTADVQWLVIEGAVELGVLGYSEGTTVTIRDAAISDSEPLPGEFLTGFGIVAVEGAVVTATRTVLDRNTALGAGSQGGDLTLRDVVVRGTKTRPGTGDFGRGAEVQEGGSLSLERVSLEDNHDTGLIAIGEGSRVTATDVVVRRTLPDDAGLHGRGVDLQDGSDFSGERIHIEESREAGILVGLLLPATAEVDDLTILDTMPGNPTLSIGRALSVQQGVFVGNRVRIERVEGEAVIVVDAEMTLTDLVIRDIDPITTALQPSGWGVLAMIGGQASIERAEITDIHDVAIGTNQGGARIEATDVMIGNVRSVVCASPVCAPGGHGVFAYFDSTVAVRDFLIDSPEVCGVHVAGGGSAALTEGVVRGAAIGACVQSDAQAVERLQEGVFYLDNGTPLDSTMLPVPEPASEL